MTLTNAACGPRGRIKRLAQSVDILHKRPSMNKGALQDQVGRWGTEDIRRVSV